MINDCVLCGFWLSKEIALSSVAKELYKKDFDKKDEIIV